MAYKDRHPPIPGAEGYSFCESVTAGPNARWHIRKLDTQGLKFSGGVTTESLCGRVVPSPKGLGGWDVEVPINEQHLGHCCQECAQKLRKGQ